MERQDSKASALGDAAPASGVSQPSESDPTSQAPSPSPVNLHEALGLPKDLLDIIKRGEERLQTPQDVQSLPSGAYLTNTVVPVLIEGLRALDRERPPNPTEYLGVYLLRNCKVAQPI
ncbi:hypothetical protein BC832DRAFT_566455 [Gaertneriomyces semiglobifer]|nr:hypothetical protein BC832DRAFT_566455 [Gaertneriomyces semiglobifer]